MAKRKVDREYLGRLVEDGCIICGSPAEVHHIGVEGMGRRADDREAIPLCPFHHRTGNQGEAVHAGRESWEANFGTEQALLEKVRQRMS